MSAAQPLSLASSALPRERCNVLQDAPFPLYDQVKAEHVVPGMRHLFAELNAEVTSGLHTHQPRPLHRSRAMLCHELSAVLHASQACVSLLSMLCTLCITIRRIDVRSKREGTT